jgi:glycosyltransferase involved in cell wall biosynthesis
MLTMLHIVEVLTPFGGVPVKLLRLAKAIDPERGRLVFTVFQPAALDDVVSRIGSRVRQVGSVSPVRIVRALDRAIEDERPDVVCSHHTRGLITGYLAAKRHGLPLIHHEHSSAHYRRGIGRLAAQAVMPRVDRIICNSLYTMRSIQAAYPGIAGRLCHVHDPVVERPATTAAQAVREELGLSETDLVIGHIGGLIPERNQATLIRAVDLLRRSNPRIKLVLVGDGPERARLEELVRTLHLDALVRFAGYRDPGDLLGVMDLYVNPCVDEGFGIAVVEAMLAGLPVVIADAGSHPELIIDGECGFLYEPGNPEELAARLQWLIDHPVDARRMGARARLHAQRQFATDRFMTGYLNLMQPVAGCLDPILQ